MSISDATLVPGELSIHTCVDVFGLSFFFLRTQQQLKDETLNNCRNKLILVSIVIEQFQWPCYILMVVIRNLKTITTVAFCHCGYLSVHC